MPVSVERRLAALNIFEGQQPSGGSAFESGRPAFDKRVDRYRIRAGVGFAGVGAELHFNLLLIRRNEHEAHVGIVTQRLGPADRGDYRRGVGRDGPFVHGDVPRIVGRKHFESRNDGVGLRRIEVERLRELPHLRGLETRESGLINCDTGLRGRKRDGVSEEN